MFWHMPSSDSVSHHPQCRPNNHILTVLRQQVYLKSYLPHIMHMSLTVRQFSLAEYPF